MKCTVHLVGGIREVITPLGGTEDMSDEMVFQSLIEQWHHALTCNDTHLMAFKRSIDGSQLIIHPKAIAYFDSSSGDMQ